MDPVLIAAGLGGLAGGVIGGNKKIGAQKDAERVLDAASAEWAGINLPELSPVQLERYKNLFTPQIMEDTRLSQIQLDPEFMEAQKAALAQLGELSEGGLTLQDKADLAAIQGDVARQDAARQGAIMQNMAERGMGGAGMELMQRLQSQQGGADRAAADARNVAAQAQQRALQAIMQRGQLGGAMRMQEYGMASDAARAQDEINRFNTGQRTMGEEWRQKVGMSNTDIANMEAQQANEIAQQQYENQLRKTAGQTSFAGDRAKTTSAKGEAEGDFYSGLGNTFAKGVTNIWGTK